MPFLLVKATLPNSHLKPLSHMNTPSHSYSASPYRAHRILLTAASLLASAAAHAAPLLAPGDPIFAYDLDTAGGNPGATAFAAVNYPAGEQPGFAIDGSPTTKYLNFCRHTSGIIVTPTTAAAARSLVLTTANDSSERDPASYIILGSNLPITSADKSNGFADNWTYITQGTLALPTTRGTVATPITFPNSTAFSSYWIVFPSVRNLSTSNSMQIAEIQLTTGPNGTGTPIFSPGNPVLATGWNSAIAAGEIVTRTIDGNPATKYLNFGENNSGFFVVPASGRSIIDSFQLTTANDADVRDPATWQIHGMDDSGIWSLLGSGAVTLPVARGAAGPIVTFTNTTICRAYRMTFTTVKNAASANSMQVAEAQFFGIIVPAKDTDNDLMDDDWETLYGLIVGVNDAAGDLDSDSSPNVQEYQRGTLPNKADTDNDGLTDGVETDTGTYVSATNTGSKPLNADTDGDTYTDGYEVAYGTNPNVASSVPTITWDITAGDSIITGGSGTWDVLTTANWSTDNGITNVPWDNAGQRQSAIFTGTAGTVTLAAPISADRVIVNSAGYIFNGSTLTLGSSAPVINIATGTTEMAQPIAGTAGFTKQGNGTLRLTGASNTYSGTTTLKGIGRLILAKDPGETAIPGNLFLDSFAFVANTSGLVLGGNEQIADTSIITWANVGQADTYFRLNGFTETIGGLVSDGVGGFVVIENRGFNDTTAYPDGNLIVNTAASTNFFFNGMIRNIDGGTGGGTVVLTKTGPGTQILAGSMSFSGTTTVLGGTLQINGSLPNSPLTVESGGTLAGSGTVSQGPTVNAGGTIAPGNTAIGTLTTGNTSILGTYLCQIDGPTADRITANGFLDVAGATLQFSIVNPPSAESYVLASCPSSIGGTFNAVGVPAGYSLDYLSATGQILLVKDDFSAFVTTYALSGVPSDDKDSDGLADAVEYVLGSNPTIPNSGGPVARTTSDEFIFSFVRSDRSLTQDVAIAIETTSDPNTAGDLYQVGLTTATSSQGVTVTDNGTTDTITLTIPLTDAKKFARLRVTVTP
jgi:autotransporter-associated beta strand protein